MGVEKFYHFEDWLIVKNLLEKKFSFVVDPCRRDRDGFTLFYVDKIKYDTYDQCFRASRKWIRENNHV